jgi:hypothetical protein
MALHRQANGGSDDGRLTEGRIPHAILSKALNKAFCGFEYASIIRNILTHQHQG